jgi:hypothetical protein
LALAARLIRTADKFKGREMILVRLLLFLGLAVILVAFAAFLLTKDRRYLRFIIQTLMYAGVFIIGLLLFYAFERLILVG